MADVYRGETYTIPDEREFTRSATYIWDSDLLEWVASTGSGSGGGSDTENPTDEYKASDMDDSDPSYFGFIKADGGWYILKIEDNTYRYIKGDDNYSTNWTNRASLSYQLFNLIF
jgi:hypothetical protein